MLKDDPMSAMSSSSGAAAAVRSNCCGPRRRAVPADQTAGTRPLRLALARDGKVFLTPAQLAMLLEGTTGGSLKDCLRP